MKECLALMLLVDKNIVSVTLAYAPQACLSDENKNKFWDESLLALSRVGRSGNSCGG